MYPLFFNRSACPLNFFKVPESPDPILYFVSIASVPITKSHNSSFPSRIAGEKSAQLCLQTSITRRSQHFPNSLPQYCLLRSLISCVKPKTIIKSSSPDNLFINFLSVNDRLYCCKIDLSWSSSIELDINLISPKQ